MISIAAHGEHCVLATNHEDGKNSYQLLLCNALGTPIDTKVIKVEPLFLAITTNHVFASSRDAFFVWHFRTAKSWTHLRIDSGSAAQKSAASERNRERLFHIDDNPSGAVYSRAGVNNTDDEISPSNDPICCIVASDKILLIARESGSLHRYALPNIALTNRYTLQTKPHKLALNCNSTYVF